MPLASTATSIDGGLYTWITELAQRSPPRWIPRSASGRITDWPCSPC